MAARWLESTTAGTMAGAGASRRLGGGALAKVFWDDAGRTLVHERYEALLASWPTPYERLRVPTCQGETFVLAFGGAAAPPVVLLHGGMTTSAMWARSAAAWAAHCRIFAVDLIGEPGFSVPSRPSMSSDAHARWLDDVWNALGIDSAVVVGASLGGWIALDYAIRRPQKVARLALLAPAGVTPLRLGFLLKVGPLLLLGRSGHRRALGFNMGFDAGEEQSAENQSFIDFFRLVQQHYVARTKPIPTFSSRQLRLLRQPVLAIVGGKDAVFHSAATKRRLESLVPHATVQYLPETGHALVDPTKAVLDFLLGRPAEAPCD